MLVSEILESLPLENCPICNRSGFRPITSFGGGEAIEASCKNCNFSIVHANMKSQASYMILIIKDYRIWLSKQQFGYIDRWYVNSYIVVRHLYKTSNIDLFYNLNISDFSIDFIKTFLTFN